MVQLQVIGVYPLPLDEELALSQVKDLWGDDFTPDHLEQCRAQLRSVVLVEVLVEGIDGEFDVGKFAQETIGQPRGNWQAPWAEAFLSASGEELLVEHWGDLLAGTTTCRVAFFMHFWQPDQPLLFGEDRLAAPQPTEMPERLSRLVPYSPVD